MNKSTPTKKEPIKAHRGRIVYEGRGRPIPGFPRRPGIGRPMPGRPRPFPGFPRGVRPPRRGPRVTPRPISLLSPTRGLGGSSVRVDRPTPINMAGQTLRRQLARQGLQAKPTTTSRRDQMIAEGEATLPRGNKGMVVTKKAIGANDFRKGGLTLSTVDNLKKT